MCHGRAQVQAGIRWTSLLSHGCVRRDFALGPKFSLAIFFERRRHTSNSYTYTPNPYISPSNA